MNSGKIFEKDIRDSILEHNKINNDIYILRLTDSASGFGMDSEKVRFSAKSPYDYLFHKKDGVTIAVELKSNGGTSISFSYEHDKKEIKSSQIKNLEKTNFYGIKSGFLLNFRKFEETYWMDISDFLSFMSETEKKSINISDVKKYNGQLVSFRKKKVHYVYGLDFLFEE